MAAYVATLSESAYLEIAGINLELPLAAVDDYRRSGHIFTLDPDRAAADAESRRKHFRGTSSNPDAPLRVQKVSLLIDTWGWDDSGHGDLYRAICSKLAQEWARSVCDNPWSALHQSLPERFDLAERGHLDIFRNSSFAGGHLTKEDHLRSMHLSLGRTQVACDPDRMVTGQNLCTAARLVHDDLVAVWTVEYDTPDDDLQKAGDVIVALVDLGLGREEHLDQLIARACGALRSTHAKPSRVEDKDCEGD